MLEFLKKLFNQLKEIFDKLDTTKKIIIGAVTGVVVIAFIVLFSVSSVQPNVVLFTELGADDFGQVTKKLEEMGYTYQTSGQTTIMVQPNQREVILTKLAQEKMIPKGIPGWKLFDITKWTETERELDVKYMRAVRDEIKRHIESLKNIEKADVDIAMTEDSIYTDTQTPYTAAVTVQLKTGYDKLSKKEIKGIIYLVSRAVGNRLKPENVTVTDEYANIISDFDDELDKAKTEYTILEYRHKLEERARIRMLKDIRAGLERIYSADRIQILRLNMEFKWDKVSEEQEEYTPIELEKDNPATPYSERKTKDSLVISEKTTKENFQGHGWNPEGPAGTEGNTPPGYKASDDQYAKYNKNEEIKNHAVNKTIRKIERAPYDISKVSVALAIDGIQSLPKLPSGEYDLDPGKEPVQTSLAPEELKKAENIVKKSINYNEGRGDQVAVENIMFDRSRYWENIRNEFKKKEQIKRILLAALIGVIALFVGFILFRAVSKELERRRRAKEEQLALEQQRMREAALRAAEEEGIDVELSLEERARLELQENAINLARERPDDVAQLLRTWLAEE
ncbi:MAG: flagellar M-ring protein FliF [Spirochaetes bacterium RBG_16_49_21]|nr:MAG: flagellar M-ring protein FliF [Spirochaetes bacterium RBG_16_49_21]